MESLALSQTKADDGCEGVSAVHDVNFKAH